MRKLGPADSAPLLAATSIVTLASSLLDQPFIIYLLRETKHVQEKVDTTMSQLWRWTFGLFFASVLLGFIFQLTLHLHNLALYTVLNSLVLFAFAGQVGARVNLQNSFRLRTIATARIISLTFALTICVFMWIWYHNALAIIAFYVATEFLVFCFIYQHRMKWRWVNNKNDISKNLRSFILMFSWSNTLIWASTQGCALISAYFSTPAQFAQLALALSGMRTVIDIVSTPAQQALIPTLKSIRENGGDAAKHFSNFMTRLAVVSNGVVAGVFLSLPIATRIFLGPTWSSFPEVAIAVFCGLPLLVHSTLDRMWLVLIHLERVDLKLKNALAAVDTSLATVFAALGIVWATCGVGIRAFVALFVRRRVTSGELPSVYGLSPVISCASLLALPFLFAHSSALNYFIGSFLGVCSVAMFFKTKGHLNREAVN